MDLTDEQILQITHTAHLGEIAQGRLAQSALPDNCRARLNCRAA